MQIPKSFFSGVEFDFWIIITKTKFPHKKYILNSSELYDLVWHLDMDIMSNTIRLLFDFGGIQWLIHKKKNARIVKRRNISIMIYFSQIDHKMVQKSEIIYWSIFRFLITCTWVNEAQSCQDIKQVLLLMFCLGKISLFS